MRKFASVLVLLVAFVAILSCNKPPEEDTTTDMPIATTQPSDAPLETTTPTTDSPATTLTTPGGDQVTTNVIEPGGEPPVAYKDPLPTDFGEYKDINIKVDPPVNVYDFEAVDINGNVVKLVDFRGSWIYIDFWATWCPPCMAEMPNVGQLQTKIPGLLVLGISLDDKGSVDKVKDAMTKLNLHIPQFIDADQKEPIADKYGVNAIPFSVLVNPEGKIVMKAVRGEKMFEAIEQAMKG